MNKQFPNKSVRQKLLWLLNSTKIHLLAQPFFASIGHILIFHRVCLNEGKNKLKSIKGIEVTPEYLENVIGYFRDNDYEIVSLDQLVKILAHQICGKKYVIFTLDDGYVDNYTFAYPIFRKHNVPFAIYVTTGFVDRQAAMWEHSLNDLIFNNRELSFKIGDKTFEYDCSTLDVKESTYLNVRSLIRAGDENECLNIIKNIFSSYGIDPYKRTDELALTWDQIKELNADPLVTLGVHTVNHWPLGKLSPSAAKHEILESKKRMELKLNCEVKHFAYPYGGREEVGKREFELAKECGFQTATTTRSANIFLEHRNYLNCLPRFDMANGVTPQKMQFLTSGITHCFHNRFKRVVTL